MLCLKQRDGRKRTKEKYSVKKVKDVKSKEGQNIMRKPIEMLTVILQEDSWSKNEILLPIDEFIWRTWREGEMSKNEILQLTDKFVW